VRSGAVEDFWRSFRAAADLAHDAYDVVACGDSPALKTELAELIVSGVKRATAGLVRQFGPGAEPPPVLGGYVVVVDGDGRPRAIWRTTEVRTGPLDSVDERFAFDEGEGDRTREWWLDAHRRYFGRKAATEGFDMHDKIETVFERFEVVWPPEIADANAGADYRERPAD